MRLLKQEVDNGNVICRDCRFHGSGDFSIGVNPGCQHPILYDEKGDVIEEINDLMIDCMNEPNHCSLFLDKAVINFKKSIVTERLNNHEIDGMDKYQVMKEVEALDSEDEQCSRSCSKCRYEEVCRWISDNSIFVDLLEKVKK